MTQIPASGSAAAPGSSAPATASAPAPASASTAPAAQPSGPSARPTTSRLRSSSPDGSYYALSDDEEGGYNTITHTETGRGVKLLYSKSKVSLLFRTLLFLFCCF